MIVCSVLQTAIKRRSFKRKNGALPSCVCILKFEYGFAVFELHFQNVCVAIGVVQRIAGNVFVRIVAVVEYAQHFSVVARGKAVVPGTENFLFGIRL